jgi:hypothetical protein
MDIFFITYDEPHKEETWAHAKKLLPQAQRVDGIKGFSRAHKECAKRSQTERFFTIDGDSLLIEGVFPPFIDTPLLHTQYVLSWSSTNSVNGLAYGNGGIKNWPRQTMLELSTHEEGVKESAQTDFCFSVPYFQMPQSLSTTYINYNEHYAFRSGFREGVKMSLDKGLRVQPLANESLANAFHRSIFIGNLERLRIWCSIGADVPNGLWAIYGARMGCYMTYMKDLNLASIANYDWFERLWKDVSRDSSSLLQNIDVLGKELNEQLGLDIQLFAPEYSRFFKSVYTNRLRSGLMFKEDEFSRHEQLSTF